MPIWIWKSATPGAAQKDKGDFLVPVVESKARSSKSFGWRDRVKEVGANSLCQIQFSRTSCPTIHCNSVGQEWQSSSNMDHHFSLDELKQDAKCWYDFLLLARNLLKLVWVKLAIFLSARDVKVIFMPLSAISWWSNGQWIAQSSKTLFKCIDDWSKATEFMGLCVHWFC